MNRVVDKFKVKFCECILTVRVMQHEYVRFDNEQSQPMQNVENVTYMYVGLNGFFFT